MGCNSHFSDGGPKSLSSAETAEIRFKKTLVSNSTFDPPTSGLRGPGWLLVPFLLCGFVLLRGFLPLYFGFVLLTFFIAHESGPFCYTDTFMKL